MDDLGDSPVVPWRPDRANPQAQNLQAVLETVQTTTKRVADAWLSGALDWMALGHMLAVEGAEPTLTAAAGDAPLLDPGHVVLFAHALSQSTRFERGQIERLSMARVALEEVRSDPEGAASQALQLLASRSDHYAIHLDVDVVDFTDAPLSEHPSRNTGLKLDEMLRALRVLASDPGLVAITLAELNPHNAAADEGLLERFAAAFADAISGR